VLHIHGERMALNSQLVIPDSAKQDSHSFELLRCIAAEKVWIDSDDLYRYVNAHSSALLVVNGAITSSDPTVQQAQRQDHL
jgi:hypothetical protein